MTVDVESRATEMVLLTEMVPSAIDRAMQSLPIRLQTEAESSASTSYSQFYLQQCLLQALLMAIDRALKRHFLVGVLFSSARLLKKSCLR